jgi:Metalloenzyme superfamily
VSTFACSETQKFGHVTFFWNGNRSGFFDEDLETFVEVRFLLQTDTLTGTTCNGCVYVQLCSQPLSPYRCSSHMLSSGLDTHQGRMRGCVNANNPKTISKSTC